jgi:GTP diphosphokinase / guanosine-3',5'-bis(diphosphate) 3'-diphosphatase
MTIEKQRPEIVEGDEWQFSQELEGLQPEDIPLIQLADKYAAAAHAGQFRKSGEEYISHPRAVTTILCNECGIKSSKILAASLLHDSIEDTSAFGDTKDQPYSVSLAISIEKIKETFPEEVATWVGELSKPKIEKKEIIDKYHANVIYSGKLETVSSEAKLIKMADRLHNLRTLLFRDAKKQRSYILETLTDLLPACADLADTFPDEYTILYEKIKQEIREITKQIITNQDLAIRDGLNNIEGIMP